MAKASTTSPAREHAARPPSGAERRQFWEWLQKHEFFENYMFTADDWHSSFWIAVFDDYKSAGPEYAGKIMLAVWEGYPDQVEMFRWSGTQLKHIGTHSELCRPNDPVVDACDEMLGVLNTIWTKCRLTQECGFTEELLIGIAAAIHKAKGLKS